MRMAIGLIALVALVPIARAETPTEPPAPNSPPAATGERSALPAAAPATAQPSPSAPAPSSQPAPSRPPEAAPPPQATNLPNPPMGATAPASGSFVAGRGADQSLASSLRGRAVYDPKNEKIGTVDDLVVDSSGKLAAVVIGVGGFLGIGTKDVAVPYSDLKTGNRDGAPIFVLDHTREELKNAPAFDTGRQKRE